MATWPSTLVINKDGFSESPADRVMRSNMDIGPQKIRRRTTASVKSVEFKMLLTTAQVLILDDFFYANDSSAFDFVHPRTGLTVRARFKEPPNYASNETLFAVSIKLEILP